MNRFFGLTNVLFILKSWRNCYILSFLHLGTEIGVNSRSTIKWWLLCMVLYYNTCPPVYYTRFIWQQLPYEHMCFTKKHMFCSKSMHGWTWILNLTVLTNNGLAYVDNYLSYTPVEKEQRSMKFYPWEKYSHKSHPSMQQIKVRKTGYMLFSVVWFGSTQKVLNDL